MYLLMRSVFDELGYRRYEWKCDSLNAPSRSAALRYGFQLEGIFRKAIIYKSRSRDTAWFSIIEEEWPRIRTAFQVWLDPGNFDAAGGQLRTLVAIRASL
jgi:RimJ/RimL family protein N-acetyltransferase